jgi:cholesterol oxidase
MAANKFDYDWLVIGSGFGGSVSALRLTEKGYAVGVIECGRRFRDEDFAETTWQLGRFLWAPFIGLKGIFRLTPFKDVFIANGSGVGGGSLVYANTLYRAKPEFFRNVQWQDIDQWEQVLQPHYDTAERMLGVQTVPFDSSNQQLIMEVAKHYGTEDSFRRTPCAVYFGEPGETVSDPYFNGTGPDRTGCTRCGSCMVGCRNGAKNTLVKNYLWFAEKNGATIMPEHQVVDVVPIGAADGSDGYTVTTERPGAWFFKERKCFTARGVIFAAGTLGTNRLLANCKHGGSLPQISNYLGELVRTNSESILTVRLPEDRKTWNDVAISCSIHVDADTHIEFVTYGRNGDAVSLLYTSMVGKGTRLTRPLMWLGGMLCHPIRGLKTFWPFGWSRRMVMFLVMQALDNAIALRPKKRWFGRGYRLTTEQNRDKPNPTFIAAGNAAAAWLAEHTGGIPQSMLLEAAADIPTTAHLLGGAVIGKDAASGVIDRQLRVFGYRNLLVCDGAAVPANPGVNPSLTITALAEHAMSQIPAVAAA